ncbi:MAG: hypothetical protein ACT4PL_07840 [Phycisphaerales bacterium]
MKGVVSPYHLTTREPALFAALLLLDKLVTFLPTPRCGESPSDVRAAFKAGPRYERALRSWLWSAPLWYSGVLRSTLSAEDGDLQPADPVASVHAVESMIRDLSTFRGISSYLHDGLFSHPGSTDTVDGELGLTAGGLDLVGADLLKGGPDPGIALPICAGLDHFAAQHGLASVRSGGRLGHTRPAGPTSRGTQPRSPRGAGSALSASVAQRAEARLAAEQPTTSFALPIPVQAGAGTIARFREATAHDRELLAKAMNDALSEGAGDARAVRAAARAFARSVNAATTGIASGDDDEGAPVVMGLCRITAAFLPCDVALTAATVAARSVGISGRPVPGTKRPAIGRFIALTVEPMSVAVTGIEGG